MKRFIVTLAAIALLAGPAFGQQVTPEDTAKTFVGTQYYHLVEGRDEGHNTGSVIAGVRIAGKGTPTRWYFGATMADQESPQGKGGFGPSLIMVSDVQWFSHKGKPVVSVVGALSWVDAAKYDPETGEFSWGPWTDLGLLFHVSDAAKLTLGATGSPASDGFISNIGIGPGLFVTDPERRIKDIIEGAIGIVGGLFPDNY